ncbi:MAG: rod shape-determining protein RodA [Rhodospirillaceae bacterium]|nr:rod shape-determining protein RodA [Rhodospirillaceae bacterium]
MSMRGLAPSKPLSIGRKVLQINWGLVLLITLTAAIGIAMLYSAANGSWDPWATRQIVRYGVGLFILFTVALVDIRFWRSYAYLIYGILLVMLVAVEVVGSVGMGAQRWINLGVIKLQPSELMKVGIVLALARYFHSVSAENVRRLPYLFAPILMIGAPSALVLKQPDLGTALFLIMTGAAVFFAAGVRLWKFGLVFAAAGAAVPIAWSMLLPYQQKRIFTFLDPETDPLGAGYNILQSKIALGSGGLFGKGFMQGSQSHLNFLPEKQTDFIFTMLAEEFGMVGGLVLLGLYTLIMFYGYAISLRSRNHFGRLLAMGITCVLFIYVFINIAMVMGLIPVVGVPLPLISYGGTAMLTLMIGMGFLIGTYIHRDVTIPRHGGGI